MEYIMQSASQIQQYHENGFLLLENAISSEDIMRLKTAALKIVDNFDIKQHKSVFSTTDRDSGRDDYFYKSAENIHCFLEEGALDEHGTLLKPARLAINKIGHAMHDLNPEFEYFCRLPIFPEILHDIGYLAPLLWQTMYIFKQPHIGGEVRWHQDGSYLITEPRSVTGMWIAIEDAHRDNGCLWVQPGGHRSPLREAFNVNWSTGKGQLTDLDPTPWPHMNEALAVEVAAGSVVIFHDHMPHYSSQNLSPHSRHAFTMHVAEKESSWSERNWLQRSVLGDFEL
jgi:phytanoyl-CoA hydroxylase